MRSFLLICATILCLAIAFVAYLWFQPAVANRPIAKLLSSHPTSRPQATTKISGLGTVHSGWIVKIDPKTGEIASRFRGDRYDPQKDNTVFVEHPQSEFFGSGGKQRIFIDGKTGHVVVSNVAANQKPGDFSGKM